MEAKDHNYGVAGDEVAQERGLGAWEQGPVTMGTQSEKTLSILAHLSIFLNLVTGFLGPVAALTSGSFTETGRATWRSRLCSRCGTRWRGL